MSMIRFVPANGPTPLPPAPGTLPGPYGDMDTPASPRPGAQRWADTTPLPGQPDHTFPRLMPANNGNQWDGGGSYGTTGHLVTRFPGMPTVITTATMPNADASSRFNQTGIYEPNARAVRQQWQPNPSQYATAPYANRQYGNERPWERRAGNDFSTRESYAGATSRVNGPNADAYRMPQWPTFSEGQDTSITGSSAANGYGTTQPSWVTDNSDYWNGSDRANQPPSQFNWNSNWSSPSTNSSGNDGSSQFGQNQPLQNGGIGGSMGSGQNNSGWTSSTTGAGGSQMNSNPGTNTSNTLGSGQNNSGWNSSTTGAGASQMNSGMGNSGSMSFNSPTNGQWNSPSNGPNTGNTSSRAGNTGAGSTYNVLA